MAETTKIDEFKFFFGNVGNDIERIAGDFTFVKDRCGAFDHFDAFHVIKGEGMGNGAAEETHFFRFPVRQDGSPYSPH